ncbi:MAG: hypothetical protein ACJAUV_001533 [Flavobacteriales bacterium]|jgi:hypothetical protein
MVCLLFSFVGQSQQPIGAWREHLSYGSLSHVETYNNQIIALSDRAVFIHDITDGSIKRISKIQGMSGVGVLSMGVDSLSGMIIVGYDNGFFDVIQGNKVTSYSDIERSNISGDIGIYSVFFYNQLAYLSTGFGIVVFDPIKKEIKETYYIGANATQLRVNDIGVYQNKMYAATNNGVFYADVNNPNLTDFRNWTRDESINNSTSKFNHVAIFADKLLVNYLSPDNSGGQTYSDTIYRYDGNTWSRWRTIINGKVKSLKVVGSQIVLASNKYVQVYNQDFSLYFSQWTYETTPKVIYSSPSDALILNDNVWIVDTKYGLVKWHVTEGLQEYIVPNGPAFNNMVQMSMYNDNLWISSGAVAGNWNNTYSTKGFYAFVDEQWASYSSQNMEQLSGTYDFIVSTIDPSDPTHLWVGSWAKGMFELKNGVISNHYSLDNSPLEKDVNRNDGDFVKVSGLTYDIDGNLWISNPQCSYPLKVLTSSGDWHSFDLGGVLPLSYPIAEIIISEAGYKWMLRPRKRGMIVFDDNGTLANKNDDRWKILSTEIGNGELPSMSINTARMDLDGEMWLGSDAGIAIFYNPDEVFDNEEFKAEQILIEQDGNVQILLESEVITTIEIDGANRKWIGTQASGVYLLSSDGTRQLHHFTSANSPLIDNEIKDIVLNHGNGEVFFATSKGLVSYKSTATTGLLEVSDPIVYPNPVPPGYNGVIAVKNLVANSFFKVVDIYGNMIFEGQTEGGQAVWNGKNYNGDKVETGIYLFLITDDTGKKTNTAKVLVTK